MKFFTTRLGHVIIGALLLTLMIISNLYYVKIKDEEQQLKTFINHLYFSIDHTIDHINFIIEKDPKDKILKEYILTLDRKFLETDHLIKHGNYLMNNNLYHTNFFRDASDLLWGVNWSYTSNQKTLHIEHPPIGENGWLEENDLKLLKAIKKHLELGKQKLYSEKTRQENPNLSIHDINHMIENYFWDFEL